MRSFWIPLILIPASLGAATIPCGNGGLNDSGPISLATTVLGTPGYACEQQDKIYSNFNLISGSVAGINVQFFFQTAGPFENHTVQLSGNLSQAFAVEYDISVDLAVSPNRRLSLVGVDINAAASGGNPTVTKSSPDFATIVASKNTGSSSTPIANLITVHVIDTFNPNGGAATAISNSFVESAVPEPSTMVLLGGALVFLASRRRRT